MKRQLIIISAGSFAREILSLAKGIARHMEGDCDWEIKGFLDNRVDILKGKDLASTPIISSVEDYDPEPDDIFICAIGKPKLRKLYVRQINEKEGKFTRLIAPSAILTGKWKKRMGKGITIGPFSLISADVSIGQHVMICDHVSLGHDVRVGRFSQIGAFVFVGGGVTIGKRVTIHPHATILPGAVIEDGATVGAGSVVLSHVGEKKTVFGVPALEVRT